MIVELFGWNAQSPAEGLAFLAAMVVAVVMMVGGMLLVSAAAAWWEGVRE